MKNILTEALVNLATNASFIFSYTNSAKLRTEIVDAYLNGENISKFSSLFIYRQADRSIFQEPEKDKVEIVSKIRDEIINHIRFYSLQQKNLGYLV